MKSLVPFDIEKFEINHGEVSFVDLSTKPEVHLKLHNLNVLAVNLTNVPSPGKTLPASIDASSDIFKNGSFKLGINLAPLNKIPTFDLNTKLENIDLVELNDFIRAYGKFDVKKGTFHVYSEVAAKEGFFNGYVKPIIKDLEVTDLRKNENEDTFWKKIWKVIVGASAEVLENDKKEQIGSKIPIHGKFGNPEVDLWSSIGSLLKNAFIRALVPSIEHSINLKNVPAEKEKKKTSK